MSEERVNYARIIRAARINQDGGLGAELEELQSSRRAIVSAIEDNLDRSNPLALLLMFGVLQALQVLLQPVIPHTCALYVNLHH